MAVAATGAQTDWLILEITESSVMEDPDEAAAALDDIAGLGICLSLDDFGTGFSSLSYLQRLPVTELKIDRSFVSGLSVDNRDGSASVLFRSITALGASLNMRIVAEGIETTAAPGPWSGAHLVGVRDVADLLPDPVVAT